MSLIKDTLSSMFSKNKKKNEGFSSENEKESGIEEKNEDHAEISDASVSENNEEHETEFEKETANNEDLSTDPDWEKRVLCSDGNCIGIIGPDGRCKECGKPYEGTERLSDPDNEEKETPETHSPDEGLTSDESDFNGQAQDTADDYVDDLSGQTDSDSDWEDRTLCSDGNCIGVIGPDGRCKECGKPYEG